MGDARLRLTSDSAELRVEGGGRLTIRAGQVVLAAGSASVRLEAGTVSLNDGGLEVT